MAHDVFISYSSSNKPVADAVCAGLEAEGIRCWIAPRDVLPGQNYGESIVHAIAACKVVVLVFSAATNVSQAVIREAERAMHNGKPIIPFRIEDVPMSPGLEFFLASCHWLDAMSPPLDRHIGQLALSVKRLMGEDVAGPIPLTMPDVGSNKRSVRWWAIPGAAAVALAAAFLAWPKGKSSPQAQTEAPPAETRTGIDLGVSLAGAGSGVIASHFSADDAPRYLASESDGVLTLESKGVPENGKLVVIRPASKDRWLMTPPPDLELKLLNRGTKTVFVQRALLEVKSSRVSTGTPWLLDGTRLDKGFVIRPLGAVPEDTPKLSLGIAGPEDAVDADRLEPARSVEENKAGEFVMPLPRAPRAGIEEVLFGRLNGESFEVPFKVLPAAKPRSSPKSPEPLYEVELRSDGADYEVSCDLSQTIRAGDGDRFFLRLHAADISRHEFKLTLEYDDGSGSIGKIAGPVVKATIRPGR
jgi:hypothetical protein